MATPHGRAPVPVAGNLDRMALGKSPEDGLEHQGLTGKPEKSAFWRTGNGERPLTDDLLQRIAEALKCKPKYLLREFQDVA